MEPVYRPVIAAILIGISIKGLLFLFFFIATGTTPLQMMAGHDGKEYLEFSQVLADAQTQSLSPSVLRHDPGLPALVSILFLSLAQVVPLTVIALFVQLLAFAGGVYCFARLAQYFKVPPGPVTAAYAAGYPAAIYFGQFHLTEQLFCMLILWSLYLMTSGRIYSALLLAGLSATVRSTGIFLPIALALYGPAKEPLWFKPDFNYRKMLKWAGLCFSLGLLPWILCQFALTIVYNTDVSSYRPQFGYPFSGFIGFSQIGVMRSGYIIFCVTFFIGATLRMAWLTAGKIHIEREILTLFTVVFLTFHLCLKSLFYIDHTVFTLNYFDRYLLPLWPLCLLAVAPWVTWRVVSGLTIASVAIAAYWMHNYLATPPGKLLIL